MRLCCVPIRILYRWQVKVCNSMSSGCQLFPNSDIYKSSATGSMVSATKSAADEQLRAEAAGHTPVNCRKRRTPNYCVLLIRQLPEVWRNEFHPAIQDCQIQRRLEEAAHAPSSITSPAGTAPNARFRTRSTTKSAQACSSASAAGCHCFRQKAIRKTLRVLFNVSPQLGDRPEPDGAIGKLRLDRSVGVERIGHPIDHA